MLDRAIQTAIKPLLVRAARVLVKAGIGADALTVAGFVVGLPARAGHAARLAPHGRPRRRRGP
jgi:hypothetical protein